MLCAVLANAILLVGTSFSAAEVDEQAAAQSKAVTATPSRQLTTPTVPNNSAAEERSSPANQRASNAEALKLRPGEQTGEGTRGRALVLGMALQEAKNGHPRIVDVTTASPAWDAGIKKGDEIVSFQGLQADTYRKWIDGMQRLATGLPVGAPILVIVSRDGKQIPYRVLSPGPAVRAPRPNPLVQQGNPVVPPPSGTAGAAPPGPLVAPALEGNDIAIANAGPFGAFFAGATEGATDRAIAHIVRLNASPSTNAAGVTTGTSASEPNSPQSPSNGATSVPPKGRVRIGLAGFHDDPSGMVVMVDVGALPAGTYSVRISDPSVMGGLNEVGTAPAASTQQPQPEVANTATSPTGGVTEATPTANQGPPASAPPNGPRQPVPAPAAN
ncbi:MAG TPA: PDZ domain-containing protein, partial [Lacipirellulaceae bacterium]|nr:PDZ domain-containing protein [Lacipirellulaceae bacterium]